MSITENSLFVRFFLSLWLCLKNAAANSALGRVCDRLEGWFLRQAENSAICTFVWREGRIPRAWPHSIACRLFTAIINIPCALFKAVYRAGKRVWDASLFCRLIGALGGASFLFLGLFMMVMLMTPHAMWNNVYGLMGAVALTGLFVVGSASRPKHRLELDTLGPYMTFYMAFICIALAGSLSTLSLRFFAFHLTGFLLVLLVVSMVRKYEQLQLMVALAVLGLSVAALYGCYQSYIGVDIVASQQDMNLNQGMPGRAPAPEPGSLPQFPLAGEAPFPALPGGGAGGHRGNLRPCQLDRPGRGSAGLPGPAELALGAGLPAGGSGRHPLPARDHLQPHPHHLQRRRG